MIFSRLPVAVLWGASLIAPVGCAGSLVGNTASPASEAVVDTPQIGFVLLPGEVQPDADLVIRAAQAIGLEGVTHDTKVSDDGVATYFLAGGGFFSLGLMRTTHPDSAEMPVGPSSPSAEAVSASPAFLVVVVKGPPADQRAADGLSARVLAAVARGSQAVGVMMGHGVMFHQTEFFWEATFDTEDAQAPCGVSVDLTFAKTVDGRVSILSHGMVRYGREEFLVTTPPGAGAGGYDLASGLTCWLANSNEQLPTGDTAGRTAEELIEVKRGPSPLDDGTTVIMLDM